MKRLEEKDILIEEAKMNVGLIDLNDLGLLRLFEDTRLVQEKLTELQNQPFENILITI